MNLDLLIKLVKLANNNPNDNEANLAARKVCKMIAEANYKFVADVKVDPKINYKPHPTQEEFYKRKESPRRTTVWDESVIFDMEELLRNIYGSWPPKQPPSPYDPIRKEKQKAEETNRTRSKNRKCSSCGQEFDTYNAREPFVCFACEFIQHNVRT